MTNFIDLSRDFGADWDGMWEDFLQLLTDTTDAIEATAAVSASSQPLAVGSRTFALVPATRLFPVGVTMRASSLDNGAASLTGTVTAAAAGSVTLNVTAVTGAGGPYGRWSLQMGGPPGPQGPAGVGMSRAEAQAIALCL